MKLIEFIQHNDNWEDIMKSKGIKVKKELPLILFQYDMIECKFDEEWMLECRGNILDINTMKFVCISFNKFFNYGESKAAKFEYDKNVFCMEKIDGSIVKYYYDHNKEDFTWATNGTIDANKAEVSNTDLSFRTIIELAHLHQGHTLGWYGLDKNFTYIFELTSQYNTVVVPHNTPELTLLGIIDNRTGEERVPYSDQYNSIAKKLNVKLPKRYNFNTIEDIINNSKLLPALEEGYVVADYTDTKNVKRVKCKGPAYVALHHVGTNMGLNDENLFMVAKNGEIDEFVAYFPVLQERLDSIKENIKKIKAILEKDMEQYTVDMVTIKPKTRKEEAEIIKKFTSPSLMFSIHDEKITLEEFFLTMNGKDYTSLVNKIQ